MVHTHARDSGIFTGTTHKQGWYILIGCAVCCTLWLLLPRARNSAKIKRQLMGGGIVQPGMHRPCRTALKHLKALPDPPRHDIFFHAIQPNHTSADVFHPPFDWRAPALLCWVLCDALSSNSPGFKHRPPAWDVAMSTNWMRRFLQWRWIIYSCLVQLAFDSHRCPMSIQQIRHVYRALSNGDRSC